jgi:hypothetical protein
MGRTGLHVHAQHQARQANGGTDSRATSSSRYSTNRHWLSAGWSLEPDDKKKDCGQQKTAESASDIPLTPVFTPDSERPQTPPMQDPSLGQLTKKGNPKDQTLKSLGHQKKAPKT